MTTLINLLIAYGVNMRMEPSLDYDYIMFVWFEKDDRKTNYAMDTRDPFSEEDLIRVLKRFIRKVHNSSRENYK